MSQKKTLGQFFTTKKHWLSPVISEFISTVSFNKIIDPFAGGGDLLEPFQQYETIGYDIDPGLNKPWMINDSLRQIPQDGEALCITNPPYLASYTAKRFRRTGAYQYFEENPQFDNLYLIALERCLEAFPNVIAIVPETFILSRLFRERLQLVNVLETSPFDDTNFPVLIGCWGEQDNGDFRLFKNDEFIANWHEVQAAIPNVVGAIEVKFNCVDGQIGLIGIDGTQDDNPIRFCDVNLIGADEIKISSRLRTRIWIDLPEDTNFDELVRHCNTGLARLRLLTQDVVLAPFKGNTKNGMRRRRLDFKIAKQLIFDAVHTMTTPVISPLCVE